MEKNLDTAKVHKNKVILQEVQYGSRSLTDEKSTSHIFYEVQKDTPCKTLEAGDIIKTATRLFQSVEIDDKKYYYTNIDEYILIIKKSQINADRLKR